MIGLNISFAILKLNMANPSGIDIAPAIHVAIVIRLKEYNNPFNNCSFFIIVIPLLNTDSGDGTNNG
jgi:hypothetical protein